ncbi:MAG: hypothetical protein ACREQM_17085 [Candidatus Dormibacteraceae bacterium]
MSQFCLRLLATVLLLGQVYALGQLSAQAAAGPDTWQQLSGLPAAVQGPIEAIAADPSNPLVVLAGTQQGSVYRSIDAGAHWTPTGRKLGHAITSLTFNPAVANQVLAGTTGAGIWVSADAGTTWQRTPTTAHDDIRAVTAAGGVVAAGTHHGVLLSSDGSTWTSVGLASVDVSALAVLSGGLHPVVLAGGDAELTGQPLPLYLTQNGGADWTTVSSTVTGSTMVSALLVLPATAGAASPTILLGTNGGLFQSTDGGAQWSPDNAGGQLPPVDVSSLALGGGDGQSYYVASDGGASGSGGLWVTRDGGGTFTSLRPPQAVVTALAVVPGANPLVFSVSFRPIDHAVMLWSYSDAGGTPQPPATAVPAPHQGGATAGVATSTIDWVTALSHGPEMPFLVLSAVAILVILLALGSYARSARRL